MIGPHCHDDGCLQAPDCTLRAAGKAAMERIRAQNPDAIETHFSMFPYDVPLGEKCPNFRKAV